jgi:thioredoxin reductase (NADPH)
LIIGGGPAAMSAALWCVELGLDPLLVERLDRFGGQLWLTHNEISNYLGVKATNGAELAKLFSDSIAERGVMCKFGTNVENVDVESVTAMLAGGEVIRAGAIIVATGVSRRKLNIAGEDEFRGKGVLSSGQLAKETVAGRRVLIVGGGDAALENAVVLSRFAAHTTVVHRRSELTARPEFRDAAKDAGVEFIFDSTVTAITGGDRVTGVSLQTAAGERTLPVDNVLIRIGVEPNSGLLKGKVTLDDKGYVVADACGRTSARSIYAVGDVANRVSPTISTAVGMGAAAAKAIRELIK